MKHLILFALIFISVSIHAQKITSEEINADQVPKAVKDSHDNAIGFPADKWIKLTIGNQPRYVAVVQQMNQSSGKTLQHRYRYNESGKATSNSEYRGNGKGEAKDFYVDYLGTGGNDALKNKVANLLKENTLISFEGFGFLPGNQPQYITTHRFVLTDKSGKKVIIYLDADGKEVDMSKYPLRVTEAGELD